MSRPCLTGLWTLWPKLHNEQARINMKYILEDLKAVKHLRESSAERRLAARKHEQDLAKRQLLEKRTRLREHQKYRLVKEAALFESVKGRVINFKDFDDLKMEERFLAKEETALKKERLRSQTALEEAEQKVAQALTVYQRTARENQKMKEHKKLILDELIREDERLTELEIEELHRHPMAEK